MVVWLDNGCTGVLVERDLVLYAAHCGETVAKTWSGDAIDVAVDELSRTVVVTGSTNGASHAVSYCRTNPAYQLLAGNDIAFCLLDRGVDEVATFVGPVPACAVNEITAGTDATIVGFGYDETGSHLGTKRWARAGVVSIGSELRIGDEDQGTCAGDSGSPAFARIAGEWTLIGLLSSGVEGDNCGTGYYTRLDTVVPWLETETGRDLGWCRAGRNPPASASCSTPALDEDGNPDPSLALTSELCGGPSPGVPGEAGCEIARRRDRSATGAGALCIAVAVCAARRRAPQGRLRAPARCR
jgi:V8-like Glu-specific endopeptidase